jgi:hypothetical protein
MKNLSTFEEFLNESQLNESKKAKKLSIPSKMSTVINKIQKNDPWSRGKLFSEVIEKNWDDITGTAKSLQYQHELISALAKKDYMIELSKKLHLDIGHMLSTVIKNYF